MKKKILILSQGVYPSNTPRSNRTTELAKELAKQGNDVTVYAVLGKYDYSSFENTYGVKVRDFGKLLFPYHNSDGVDFQKFSTRVLKKLFRRYTQFPHCQLTFKTPRIIRKENWDAVISIALPYPLHWGVALAKTLSPKNFPKTWIADCGDPFMGNNFAKYPFYFEYIEKWFCKKADYLTIPIKEAQEAYYPEFRDKIKVIPQGFNFNEIALPPYSKNKVPTFIYAGIFYKGIRDPSKFLTFLSSLDMDFRFIVHTRDFKLLLPFKDKLGDRLIMKHYIPREELMVKMRKADFLVNFSNLTQMQSPSKLIDYSIVERPILNITDELDTNIISEFLNGDYTHQTVIDNLDQYKIENVSKNFLKLMK